MSDLRRIPWTPAPRTEEEPMAETTKARPASSRTARTTSATGTKSSAAKRAPRKATASRAASKAAAETVPAQPGADAETLVAYYRQMLLVRRFEERAGRAYTEAKIGGYCHLNLGEEA